MSKKIFHTQMQQISSINFISHLYIQLMFIELQVTRNKTMNKMQLHFSKSPQSRRGKYLLESICVFMQKQEPPLLIPAWLLKNYLPYNPCRSSWIHVCIYHHLNKVMTCNCKCTRDNKNTVSSHCSLVPTCLPWASDLSGVARREKRSSENIFPFTLPLHLADIHLYLFTFKSQISCHFLQKTFSDLKMCQMPLL